MWPQQFESRLQEWNNLRSRCADQLLETCLLEINDYWMSTPWRPYYLHWDDWQTWPNPWQILSDDVYCDLARALGIVYTMLLINRADMGSIEIVETDQGNLVLIQGGKYILNWHAGEILNNPSTEFIAKRRISGDRLNHLLG